MARVQLSPEGDDSSRKVVLYMALELGHRSWKLAFGDGVRVLEVVIGAGDLGSLGAGFIPVRSMGVRSSAFGV